ncbi:tetratricopeptide repeat protein [Candidatus Avelusimicrobium aviculae]|uniref:tetratricopeptide repeat protein n=1 Tax=Candidatus Avelusimicrobium aviculae TaxID=3416206 RepID=UPI003D113957
MHYLEIYKKISCCSLCALLAASVYAAEWDECMEQGKKQFSAQNYSLAQDTFARCIKLDKTKPDAELSLAGVLLTQEDLGGAEKHFRSALKKMKRNSPYLSYTYSMLGDIALKRQKYEEALKLYDQSLTYNAANVNSLVGKGVITEYQGDKLGASDAYRSALAVEPLNLVARKRLINLEPYYLTDAEMLDALKQRYAVAPDKKELDEKDKELFSQIHRAEQLQGVAYLKSKHSKLPPGYVVELYRDSEFSREVLTLTGYKALQKQLGQDAVSAFQKAGVPVRDVFELRDMRGNKIFNQDSTLTDSGFFVFSEALQRRKAFLLPSEAVPPTKEHLQKVQRQVQDLQRAGYMEISRSDLKNIENKTKCSLDTLRKKMGVYVLPVTKNNLRYFILTRSNEDKKTIPYYYFMEAQSRRNPRVQVPQNSLVEMYKLYDYSVCSDDGELWE